MFGFIDNILKFSTEVFKNQYTNNSFWLGLLLINIIITIALTLQYLLKPSKDKNGNPNTSKADSLKHLYYSIFGIACLIIINYIAYTPPMKQDNQNTIYQRIE